MREREAGEREEERERMRCRSSGALGAESEPYPRLLAVIPLGNKR